MTAAFANPVAAQVAPSSVVLRRCGGTQCPPGTCDHDGGLQRDATGTGPAVAPASVHQTLGHAGQALDGGVRADMEPRLGHDFSRVRVHTDVPAAASAAAVGARAYTVGEHMVFAAGAYEPGTQAGRRLIAHELTHIVQQAGSPSEPAAALEVGAVDDPAEREADQIAAKVVDS